MLGEATLNISGTFAGEATRVLILFAAQQTMDDAALAFAQSCSEPFKIRGRLRFLCAVQPAPIYPFAELPLSRADFGDQCDRIRDRLQPMQPPLACVVDNGMLQNPFRRKHWRVVAFDNPRSDPGLLLQLERWLEQVRVQPGGGVEAN
jgi:hypothetical protein